MLPTVARKEFTDQITSKRFLALLALLLLTSAFSFYQGMESLNSQRASIVQVFTSFGSIGVTLIGGILGLLMGFDLISREKESGSLKTLLSHPVYRDQIINGKALGAFGAMGLAVIITLVIALGIFIMKGFNPTMDDMLVIGKFGLITLAYFFTFFSIALFTSALSRTSSSSLLMAFGIFLLLSFLMPMFGTVVSQAVVGPPPQSPPPPTVETVPTDSGTGSGAKRVEISENTYVEERERWEQEREDYWEKRRAVQEVFYIVSPSTNYMSLVSSLSERTTYSPMGGEDVTKNLVSFIMLPVIFFSISYVRFLRSEII